MTRMFVLLVFACLCTLSVSCSSSDAPISTVEGVASLNGAALSDCIVVFENKEERVFVTAYTDEKGNFQSSKVVPGVFQVSIKPKPRYAEPNPGEVLVEVPELYQSAATSGLKTTFVQGENQYDVDLKQ